MKRSRRKNFRIFDDEKESDLGRAILTGDLQELKNLIEGGVDVDTKDSQGTTPLIEASSLRREDIVRYLLSKNANVNARNFLGRSALHVAYYLSFRSPPTTIVELLLSAGADVNIRDENGDTPLFYALRTDVEQLLVAGADPNVQNNEGNTPLHIATKYNFRNSVKTLLDYGADPFIRNNSGELPIDGASARTYEILKAEMDKIRLQLMLNASSRGEIFDPRFYDQALWRMVEKYV